MLRLAPWVAPVALAWLFLLHAPHGGAQQVVVNRLEPDTPLTTGISGGAAHQYEVVAPAAGAFLHLEVEQRGIGLTVVLLGLGGEVLAERSRMPPPETLELSWEAAIAGAYRVQIRANGPAAAKGGYQATLRTASAAGQRERARMAGEALHAEALRLRAMPNGTGAEQSMPKFEEALTKWREAGDRQWEARTLSDIGRTGMGTQRFDKAAAAFAQALAIYRELGNWPQVSLLLFYAGMANENLSRFAEARQLFEEALVLRRELKDRLGEERALVHLGNTYSYESAMEKGRQYYEQALVIARELKNRREEGVVISCIAASYGASEQGKAFELFAQALAIARETKDRYHEGETLTNMATLLIDLGQYEKAIVLAGESLVINKELRNRQREAFSIHTLGAARLHGGEYAQARSNLEEALGLYRAIGDKYGEAMLLNHLGPTHTRLQQYALAGERLELALKIAGQIKTAGFEAETLQNLGELAIVQGQPARARGYYERALPIRRRIQDRIGEAATLSALMSYWSAQTQQRLAVFFGKQAVNSYQDIRLGIRSLERDTQQSFLRSKEDTYRRLADLLIGQGRLPEAEQVIRMLKEEEFFDYLRRDSESSPKAERATLTPEEAELEKRYREIADQLTVLGTERGALLGKAARSAGEEQRLAKLEGDLTVAGQMFQRFLDGLENELKTGGESQARVFQLRESQGMMEALGDLGKGTVALYTLVGSDRYRVILTTAHVQKGFEYPITAAELNRKILAFRQVLQNPKLDPGPLARELYTILIGPLAADLQAAKAETLMWSLDGVLRYIPMGALHDGRKYVAERWRNVVFTPASQTRLKDSVSRNWTALGLGVTKSHGVNIPALPGVAEEMRGIIRGSAGEPGVLEGTVRLDEQFTRDTMLAGLRARPPVVHVASHFQFQPGNETDSALLLGDGKLLSLAQIKALPNVFSGVELLTLSACNTATAGSGATGREVEGFAVLAQRQGAKAVVASLWPVADSSTKELMQEFYRSRQSKGLMKVEALRQAQLALLRGELAATGAAVGRQLVHDEPTGDFSTPQPPYRRDPKKPYAHPYYWAPFILIGNWK